MQQVWRKHTCWIQRIDINTQVHWLCSPNSVPDLLDNTRRANGIDLARFGDFEAAIAVILVVTETGQGGADAGVNVRVVG